MYMLITNIMLMNLVLAVVTDTFESLLQDRVEHQETIREAMLQTSFARLAKLDTSTAEGDGISVEMMLDILREIDKYRHRFIGPWFDKCFQPDTNTDTLQSVLAEMGHPHVRETDTSLQHLVIDICNFRRGNGENSAEACNIDEEEFRTVNPNPNPDPIPNPNPKPDLFGSLLHSISSRSDCVTGAICIISGWQRN